MSNKSTARNFHFALDYEDNRWKADNGQLRAEGQTLRELDEKLKVLLRNKKTGENEKIRITMEFDYNRIPSWIIQYHPYYMYRVIDI